MNFWPKKQFVEKFQLNDIYLITVPYHAAKFEKKKSFWEILRYRDLYILSYNEAKITHLVRNRNFGEIKKKKLI